MRKTYLFLTIVLFTVFTFHGCVNEPNQLWQYAGYVQDIDGNVYLAVKLGNQIWTTSNLRVTHYRNGDKIEYGYPLSTLPKYIVYGDEPNNGENPINKVIYGCLYNWFAVDDPRGLAPEGWHVPTHEDWMELVQYLDGFAWAGGKMKEVAYNFWESPNTGATNSSLFCARPGGWFIEGDKYRDLGNKAYFWSSTGGVEGYETHAWYWYLSYDDHEIDYDDTHFNDYLSVRLIKDQENEPEE